jgi:hypothetical protein
MSNILDSPNLFTPNRLEYVKKMDLSKQWVTTESKYIFGYSGDSFQRLKIKILNVQKKDFDSLCYSISGKILLFDSLIYSVQGEIKIELVREWKKSPYGLSDVIKEKSILFHGLFKGHFIYQLFQNNIYKGIVSGNTISYFFVDPLGEAHYDSLAYGADAYKNNLFVGTYISSDSLIQTTCNWGDYRVPLAKDLDIGAAYFSPNPKYCQFGWKDLCVVRNLDLDKSYYQALKNENKEWWK